jgi:hypothetical protein
MRRLSCSNSALQLCPENARVLFLLTALLVGSSLLMCIIFGASLFCENDVILTPDDFIKMCFLSLIPALVSGAIISHLANKARPGSAPQTPGHRQSQKALCYYRLLKEGKR